MNTSKSDVNVSTEIERLESERLIGVSLVAANRDRYASEIGNASEIECMIKCASVKPRTYVLPKRLRKSGKGCWFIQRIKKLFGL